MATICSTKAEKNRCYRPGVPNPRARDWYHGGLLGTRWHRRRWVAGEQVKLLCIQLLPLACITAWAPPPIRSAAVSDFHRIVNPTVGCTREGSRLGTPYENHWETIPLIPRLWRNCLSWNWTLVPKTLGGSPLRNFTSFTQILLEVPPGPGLFSSVRKCAHTISSQTNSD